MADSWSHRRRMLLTGLRRDLAHKGARFLQFPHLPARIHASITANCVPHHCVRHGFGVDCRQGRSVESFRLPKLAMQAAQKEFEQAVMAGRFPSEEVLTVLQHGSTYMPVNLKEAVEELIFGRCSMSDIDWGDAVALIRQRRRIAERAKARVARGEEPTGPVSQAEAYDLLGVNSGCSPEELASAYRRKMLQWHPDKLDTMAQELRDYATRRTARINEAYQMLRQRA